MRNKKTLVIVIDNFIRGGAETLLVGILKDLSPDYNVVLITLSTHCEFETEEIVCDMRYTLGYTNKYSFLSCVIKLRRIFNKVNPDLIHAHLLNSSQIARMANRGKFPFIYSLHSILSENAFNKSWMYRSLEKLLFDKRHFVIAVSKEVLDDYESCIGVSKDSFVIPNYVSDKFIDVNHRVTVSKKSDVLKLVAIGNFKKVKNYEYMLNAFLLLDKGKVTLDIYGGGENNYKESLQKFIDCNNLPVRLNPQSKDVPSLLSQYDLLLMSSKNEGFGIAAVEGMAVGLPLILSDLPVLRSITFQNALFFDINDSGSLTRIIEGVLANKFDLAALSKKGQYIVQNNYIKTTYLERLVSVYQKVLNP